LTEDIPSVGGTIVNLKKKDKVMKKIKLFRAGCLVDEIEFKGDEGIFDRVPFIWYAENRKKPIADYQELVIGYEGLNEYEKEKAQYWCDELFTEEEISIIKPIIENFGYGFEVCEMVTPVKIPEDGRFPYRIYTDMSVDGSTHLGKLTEHGLPFDVVFFFDLRDAIERDGGDGRCDCCGRQISELEPFGKGKDESGFETEGRYLVKTWRPLGVYDEEAETAIQEAFQSYAEDGYEDWWACLIDKHGKEKADFLFDLSKAYHTIDGEWVCKDCINLDQKTYYDNRYETRYEQS
jgi:hypothetical protein